MEKKKKFQSIQYELFAILTFSIVISLLVVIVINNVLLEHFYKFSEVKNAENIKKEINTYYNGAIQYGIEDELRELEIKNNIEILIMNLENNVIYSRSNDIIKSVERMKTAKQMKTIYGDEVYEIRIDEELPRNNFLMLITILDNGYKLYVKIPTMPIKESSKISNKVLILTGILTTILAGCVFLIISKKVVEPIIELDNITKKMAKLDFSEKYEIHDNAGEINALGENINKMSEKLESTIDILRQNNSELEKSIKEKSKIDEMRKQFISDVSHELKTPISLIQGYAEGLLENINEDEESRKFYAEVIVDESNKMDKLVKELLELMKVEYQEQSFDDKEFNLNELIKEEIKRETVKIQEKNIKIDFDESKENIVYADEKLIEKILNNYLSNAIKHCEKKDGEKKISIRTEIKGKKLRLFVYNTGEKIKEEYIDKIWDRFYKVDISRNREDGGTGIGLALVKAIMNNYQNEFGVKNYKNGVEFYCDINLKGKQKK